jgi:hypothetical protein
VCLRGTRYERGAEGTDRAVVARTRKPLTYQKGQGGLKAIAQLGRLTGREELEDAITVSAPLCNRVHNVPAVSFETHCHNC